ncbi:single-stranded DNA-binding protein [Escherichia coli]|uniref:single-stranded DNA-binding protein n=1 Tax=Enterobacteriaceae TaxID=543 RepID=UPI000663AED3|nr:MULTISPECIES: single-stranded DNA-binding protein [Enterobacteriaceae]EGO4135096.1 single-stranded DNA-binding protein [Escherichia coli]CSS28830.1 single stranded DNA-binding protein [Shigella sonnei]STH60462.1 putative prophage single stranded DNA-binding protein [Escherichia coli]HAX2347454.1 single-stranded DNA-binding protein [Escherichia coli]
MTAQIAAYGRLVDDPQVKQTSKGTPMTLARMAVSLPCSQAQDGQATLWLSVLAFGKQADQLAGHEKGNVISVSGVMQVSQWTGQDGGTRQGYQIIADSVISAKTVRPGGSRRKTTGTQGNQPPAGGDDPYGDDIPF